MKNATQSMDCIHEQASLLAQPPLIRLAWAGARLTYHRKWGPGHEIGFAVEDIKLALHDMGYEAELGSLKKFLAQLTQNDCSK